jgi:hypothetical protein
MVKDTDPSNPDAFRSRCQPEILNGAAGAIQIRIAYRRTTQYMRAASLTAASHTDIDRRFFNPFELQTPIQRRTGTVVTHGGFSIRFLEQLLHGALRCALTDDHKIPRLHEPDRPGVMCRSQNPREHIVRDRFSQKIAADISPLEDHPIDSRPFIVRKSSAAVTSNILTWTHEGSMSSACAGAAGLTETSPTSPAPTFSRHVEHKQS